MAGRWAGPPGRGWGRGRGLEWAGPWNGLSAATAKGHHGPQWEELRADAVGLGPRLPGCGASALPVALFLPLMAAAPLGWPGLGTMRPVGSCLGTRGSLRVPRLLSLPGGKWGLPLVLRVAGRL